MSALINEDGSQQRYPNGKQAYKCDTCGLIGPWTSDWVWFGSFKEVDDGVKVPTWCSEACAKSHPIAVDEPFKVEKSRRRRV